jgi:hypothetical protein
MEIISMGLLTMLISDFTGAAILPLDNSRAELDFVILVSLVLHTTQLCVMQWC